MSAPFPPTPLNLITQLKEPGAGEGWQVSWKRFLELYHAPIKAVVHGCYRHYTRGADPPAAFVEDVVATVVVDFFSTGQYRYDASKGRLRTYLRRLGNARVVDKLRKERPLNQKPLEDSTAAGLPDESEPVACAFERSLLATLVEDLRSQIPLRQFEVFERVKLKHEAPGKVASDLGIQRAMIDRTVYKAMSKLREIAARAEYQEEFYP
jgi:RNA polymerase sigma-70 factor (ECF subfamily)